MPGSAVENILSRWRSWLEGSEGMRALVLAMILVALSVQAAKAWWQYAKWGMTEGQLLAANQGRVSPCTPDVPACAATGGAHQPKFFVEGIHMLAMPVSVSFGF